MSTTILIEEHPKKHHKFQQIQHTIAKHIEGKPFHFFIVALIISDVIALFIDHMLYIVNECKEDHSLHHLDSFLKWYSVFVLLIFTLELVLKIVAFGWKYLVSLWHLFDIVIVIAGLVFSLLQLGPVYESASTVVIIGRIIRLVLFGHEIAESEKEKIEELKRILEKKERQVDVLVARVTELESKF
jgi:hypothetical protein